MREYITIAKTADGTNAIICDPSVPYETQKETLLNLEASSEYISVEIWEKNIKKSRKIKQEFDTAVEVERVKSTAKKAKK